jgi:DNA-binding response OmpR family regulator
MGTLRPSLLVVDDEVAIRHLVRCLLDAIDIVVVDAADGEQALRLAVERRPSAVLLDLKLPTMSGLDVLATLKTLPATPHTPVIMFSGYLSESDRETALSLGAFDCLDKPFDVDLLVSRICDAVQCHPASGVMNSGKNVGAAEEVRKAEQSLEFKVAR